MKWLKAIGVFLFISHFLYAPSFPHKAKNFLVKKIGKKKRKAAFLQPSKKVVKCKKYKRKKSEGDSMRTESRRDLNRALALRGSTEKKQAYARVRARSMAILHVQLQETEHSPRALYESEKTITLIRKTNNLQKKEGSDLTPSSPFERRMLERDFEVIKADCIQKAQSCLQKEDFAGAKCVMDLLAQVIAERFEIIGSDGYCYTKAEFDVHAAIRSAHSS